MKPTTFAEKRAAGRMVAAIPSAFDAVQAAALLLAERDAEIKSLKHEAERRKVEYLERERGLKFKVETLQARVARQNLIIEGLQAGH